MKKVIIVIPIYKSIPDRYEKISFNQAVNVFFTREISIVSYRGLDLTYYINILVEKSVKFQINYFEKSFFETVSGYNQLMLSRLFYRSFLNYEFILIYQLDAFVFRDELDYWCEQDYDFIGAPLIEDKYGQDKKYFWNGFNGGFSLRKVAYCLKLLSKKGPIIKPLKVYELTKMEFKGNFIKVLIFSIFRSLGKHNHVDFFKKKTYINEDLFFCLGFYVSWVDSHITPQEAWIFPKLPTVKEAARFSFERYPAELFIFNNNKLPFGCHAWQKYEYEDFWKKYIRSF